MGGVIRIKKAEYFLNSSLRMHGENVILFGDGYTYVIHLESPYRLTNLSTGSKD